MDWMATRSVLRGCRTVFDIVESRACLKPSRRGSCWCRTPPRSPRGSRLWRRRSRERVSRSWPPVGARKAHLARTAMLIAQAIKDADSGAGVAVLVDLGQRHPEREGGVGRGDGRGHRRPPGRRPAGRGRGRSGGDRIDRRRSRCGRRPQPRRHGMSESSDGALTRTVTLPEGVDLHARPAGLLVRTAGALPATVTLRAPAARPTPRASCRCSRWARRAARRSRSRPAATAPQTLSTRSRTCSQNLT